jgi:hypothetical protein
MTMSTKVRSQHEPRIRYGLCRHIRSKGMLLNIGELPENDSAQRGFLAVDKNTLPWDGTTWWCCESGKTVGPDDRPCHDSRCKEGRGCFEAEDEESPVA